MRGLGSSSPSPLRNMIKPEAESLLASLDSLDDVTRVAVIDELKNARLKEMVDSGINHKKIAQYNYQNEAKSIEGIGRLRMRIDPTHFHEYGQKYGYDCWRDNGFLKDVEKIHPELKVKCGGTKLQVGYSGENKRSSQKYNL